jgi:hypothetical protein
MALLSFLWIGEMCWSTIECRCAKLGKRWVWKCQKTLSQFLMWELLSHEAVSRQRTGGGRRAGSMQHEGKMHEYAGRALWVPEIVSPSSDLGFLHLD